MLFLHINKQNKIGIEKHLQVYKLSKEKIEIRIRMILIFILLCLLKISLIQNLSLINDGELEPRHNFDSHCGKSHFAPYQREYVHRVRRIINGMNARPHSWPWLVSLKQIGNLQHFCTGFLISRNFVLTAAHCLDRVNRTDFKVFIGLHELNQYRNVQIIEPKKLIIHEQFSRKTKKYDIGLIELSRPLNLTHRAAIICLPDADLYGDEFYDRNYYAAGWGQAIPNEIKSNSIVLKQTTLNLVNKPLCAYNRSLILGAINHIDGSNICYGDSGAPLTFKHNERWYAFGIASYASFQRKNICDSTRPSYFTNLYFFRSWIKANIVRSKLSLQTNTK